jgi:DNA-dependent RNA polymerase auxiliary subunit epsilon
MKQPRRRSPHTEQKKRRKKIGEAQWVLPRSRSGWCCSHGKNAVFLLAMSRTPYQYQFPEKDAFRATEVTEPEFDILKEGHEEQLYVDFTPVRTRKFVDKMKFLLGMNLKTNELDKDVASFRKIIFSGHRGCGKTIELQRFRDEINHREAYLALYIDLTSETEIQRFEPEDLYIILITVLVRELTKRGVPFQQDIFQDIANELVQETEVKQELISEYGFDSESTAKVGWNLWNFFGVEQKFRGIYSRDNKTTRTIREKIKLNQIELIEKLNDAFAHLRDCLLHYERRGFGKDIVFIIDGLEKTLPHVHRTLFVNDIQLISSLDAHIISCVPIQTYYEAHHPNTATFFEQVYLPMIRITPESIPVLRDVITRRVDPGMFAEGVLDEMVQTSGGCPRQLLHIVHQAILEALGEPVDQDIAQKTYRRLGNDRWITLSKEDKQIIRRGEFNDAELPVLNMLFQLQLLEYNGENRERKLNPLLLPFFEAAP